MERVRVLLIGDYENHLLIKALITTSVFISEVNIIDPRNIIDLEPEVLAGFCRASEDSFKASDIVIYIDNPAGFSVFANMAMEFGKPFIAGTNSYRITNKGTILQISRIIPCALVRFDSHQEMYAKKLAEATILAFEKNPGLYVLVNE